MPSLIALITGDFAGPASPQGVSSGEPGSEIEPIIGSHRDSIADIPLFVFVQWYDVAGIEAGSLKE
jgi:hypothetical protein